MTAATAPQGRFAAGGRGRSALLTALLVFPTALWYAVLLVAPLAIVIIFSFGVRARNGGYSPAFVFDNYLDLFNRPEPYINSLIMAAAGTIGCLLVGLPLAYFLATRAGKRKNLFILLLVIPFWTSFLIRTYSWLLIFNSDSGLGGILSSLTGLDVKINGTPFAVLVGIVYGYLPLM